MNAPVCDRDKEILRLFNAGACGSTDILRADFGQWPPRGLDVTAQPEGAVRFRWLYTPLYACETASILYKKLKKDPDAPADLQKFPAFVAVPLLAGAMAVYGMISMAGHMLGWGKLRGMVIGGDPGRRIYITPVSATQRTDVISHEHIHILQGDRGVGKGKGKGKGILASIFAEALKNQDGHTRYKLEDNEVQANMHLLMLNFYRAQQVMPATKYEFLAALLSHTLIRIGAGREFLDFVHSDRMRAAQKRLGLNQAMPGPDDEASQEFSGDMFLFADMLNSFEERKAFITDALPALYADLVEMYGAPRTAAAIRAEAIDDRDFEGIIFALRAREKMRPTMPAP